MAERRSEYEEAILEEIKNLVSTEATLEAVETLLTDGVKVKGSEGVVLKQTADGKLTVSVE